MDPNAPIALDPSSNPDTGAQPADPTSQPLPALPADQVAAPAAPTVQEGSGTATLPSDGHSTKTGGDPTAPDTQYTEPSTPPGEPAGTQPAPQPAPTAGEPTSTGPAQPAPQQPAPQQPAPQQPAPQQPAPQQPAPQQRPAPQQQPAPTEPARGG
jgi:translation initiation factor IF-2